MNGMMREIVKQFDKDPGGKRRYNWGDKAFYMRYELSLDYKFIYPAVCKDATGQRYESTDERAKMLRATMSRLSLLS